MTSEDVREYIKYVSMARMNLAIADTLNVYFANSELNKLLFTLDEECHRAKRLAKELKIAEGKGKPIIVLPISE